MSTVATAEDVQDLRERVEDSAIDRVRLAKDVESLMAWCDRHEREDRERHIESTRKLDEVLDYKRRIWAVVVIAGAIVTASAGYVALYGEWVIKHAMQDILEQHGVIKLERSK